MGDKGIGFSYMRSQKKKYSELIRKFDLILNNIKKSNEYKKQTKKSKYKDDYIKYKMYNINMNNMILTPKMMENIQEAYEIYQDELKNEKMKKN